MNKEPSPLPIMVSNAFAPKNNTAVRLTNTNKASQNRARIVFSCVLNRFSINCGIVYRPLSIKIGRKYLPTINNVSAAIHS